MRDEAARQPHALGNEFLHIAGSVFAALGVVADERLETGADIGHFFWKIQQPQESLVPGHQLQIAIDDRQALVYPVQPGLKKRLLALGC